MMTWDLLCGGGRPPRPGPVPPPTRLFDDLFYVGLSDVAAFVVRTSEGLILIDALHGMEDARSVIVSGMRELGLDPADIRYIVVSHGHGDHYGDARYMAQTYGARVIASEADWELMSRSPRAPARDLVARDGDVLRLGDFEMTMALTPGHTPGTLSLIIPATHRGERHMVAIWGGTGLPRTTTGRNQYIASLDHFERATKAAKVDASISNHPFVDDGLSRMAALRAEPTGANPFVIGEARWSDFLGVLRHCALATIADEEE